MTKTQIEESSQYQNLIGEKKTIDKPISLLDHMNLDEEEKEKYSDQGEKEWKKLFLEAGFSHYKITATSGLNYIIEVYP